jgi:hypothetical protein
VAAVSSAALKLTLRVASLTNSRRDGEAAIGEEAREINLLYRKSNKKPAEKLCVQ